MTYARRQNNGTLLPDGTVLVTGGSSGSGFDNSSSPVYAAELWNPSNGAWTTLASASVYRGYHSTAVLLPDGRVLNAGGNKTTGSTTYQVFSPPYLFKGVRPTITSAPASAAYGSTFFVQTLDAASITKVTLIRLPSVTHAFDANQRLNYLPFTPAVGGLNLTAPPSANVAPPGHYMLFLVNGSGVPSVAAILVLGTSALPTPNGFRHRDRSLLDR